MGEFGIVGDPKGMRALADQLVGYASTLRGTKSDTGKAFTKVEMAGPFADQCVAALDYGGAGFNKAADILDGVAKTLRSSATEVEDRIDAERRRRERLAREAAEREKQAGSRG